MITMRLGSLRSRPTISRRMVRLPSVAASHSSSSCFMASMSDVLSETSWMKPMVVLLGSTVFGVGEVEAAAGVPGRTLVAVGGDAVGVLQHPGQVQQVPGHEGGVAVREVVLGAARAGVQVGRPGPGLADPAGVGLGRDDVAEVLQ